MKTQVLPPLYGAHDKKKQLFRYRKGQWRKRTITLLSKMRAALDNVDKSQNLPQNFYDMAATLERFGKQGEEHLKAVDSLDFSPFVKHDIGMVLRVIASFSQHFILLAGDNNLVAFYPEDDVIWEDAGYVGWSLHTRRQYRALNQHLMKENET